jgi:hypothetical protein
LSVKNNILEVIGSFVNEIRAFLHWPKPTKARANTVFHANFPALPNWKGIEIFVAKMHRDAAFLARHDVAAAPSRCNAR